MHNINIFFGKEMMNEANKNLFVYTQKINFLLENLKLFIRKFNENLNFELGNLHLLFATTKL